MQWYARQVANHPCSVILLVLSAGLCCAILSITLNDLPSFKDPLLGFEPRNTLLSARATAWQNLLKSTAWDGLLTFYPLNNRNAAKQNNSLSLDAAKSWQKGAKKGANSSEDLDKTEEPQVEVESLKSKEEDRDGVVVFSRAPSSTSPSNLHVAGRKHFFCNNPTRDYAHVVVRSTSGTNLFTVEGLHGICDLDNSALRSSHHFPTLCEVSVTTDICCRSWHIASYVALLRNLSSCHDIRSQDVTAVLQILTSCAPFYHKMKLSHDCAIDPALCRGVPKHCIEYDAVYNILHYLSDINFLNPDTLGTNLTYATVFLPMAQSVAALDYYQDLEQLNLCNDVVEIVGMELGLKYKLFEDCLLHDTVYVATAAVLVYVLLWMYTSSFFVTFMTFCGVSFSLVTAYFTYTVIYRIEFFPFINVLTIIIIVGIGADDACIYCKIWNCAKAEKNNGTLVKLVRDTLHHACLSMFITSVTTAVAFFGSVISNITAVRCFSIFAGTAVLANFLFTMFWLPASVIMAEKWCSPACLCVPPLGLYLPQFQHLPGCSPLCSALWRMHYSFVDSSRVFFEKILPCIVVKARYIWLVLFSGIAFSGAMVVFYYPRLQLPDSKEFQLFNAEHPFERYDLELKNYFWFEKAKEQDSFRKLPIRVVWGVLPEDSGDHLDPYSRGKTVLDVDFNVAKPRSQQWLYNFCLQLRNQSFYQSTHGPLMFNCFIETFKIWMERRCVDGITDMDRTPCCESSKFPFSERVFNYCIKKAVGIMHHTPGYFAVPSVEGIRFSKSTGKVQAVVIQYDSIYSYSNSYKEMHEFKTTVDGWVSGMMQGAPRGMKNGWFTSDLEFYDLQDSLSTGTMVAIGVAVAVSLAALLFTTLNLLISIFAVITISCIIVVTVGSLVLLGWKLNVLESTTVSIAIGLAVDLTLHYGVAYRLSSQEDRESSVVFALSRVGSPVAMAAFTTLMAGALIFPSAVLAYLQIGTFLVLLMAISWLFSTFFFLSLLSVLGPQNGQLQLSYPSFDCCESSVVNSAAEKNAYALSESTLSSSSASYPANQIPTSESHELEPLTALTKDGRIEVPKYKKKYGHRSVRPRSGSLSSASTRTRDATVSAKVSRTPRKVSLPTVNVTFHGEQTMGAASSSTGLCTEEEREPVLTKTLSREDLTSDGWVRKEISV